MKKRWRIALLALLAVFALGFYSFRSHEPTYQGRKLSEWLHDLPREPGIDEDVAEVRRREINNAVRQIGTNALPLLLKRLKSPPKDTPVRDKLESWLNNKQSLVRIKIPWDRGDKFWEALQGLKALGRVAAPAIPQLAKLLQDPDFCGSAGECLRAIGPATVPTLWAAWTNTNTDAHREAFLVLGDIGHDAKEIAPRLEPIIRDPANPLAGEAASLFAEISDKSIQFLPLFAERLTDTNFTRYAAFALARTGPEGLPFLLGALTNTEPRIRAAARAGLRIDPDCHIPTAQEQDSTNSVYRFTLAVSPFGRDPRLKPDLEPLQMALLLNRSLGATNPVIRKMVVELLGRYGLYSVAGLSRAALDEDPTVRSLADAALKRLRVELREGGVIRGSRTTKQIALLFTGHEYAEGGETILRELAKHQARASFFLTGTFLRTRAFTNLAHHIIEQGHYVGPHSGKHLLYCSWDPQKRTLVDSQQFGWDVSNNTQEIPGYWTNLFLRPHYFLPPFEHYNQEIAEWSLDLGLTLINFTPGTRSNADYTDEADTNFVSSQTIFDSIVAREKEDSNGLNGFLLLFHLGAGPGRKDKFHTRFGELLDYLAGKGYQFVRVDELFEGR